MALNEKDDPNQRVRKPRQALGCIATLVGLLLVLAVGWWGYYSYRQGRILDLSNPEEQQRALRQLDRDVDSTGEALKKFNAELEGLRQRFIGKPPESDAEIKQLVKESEPAANGVHGNVQVIDGSGPDENGKNEDGTIVIIHKDKNAGKPPPVDTGDIKIKRSGEPDATLKPGQKEYQDGLKEFELGCESYQNTSPSEPSEKVQKYLHLAAPHFEASLNACDAARSAGYKGSDIDRLEGNSAKRLYDCRKRMELKR